VIITYLKVKDWCQHRDLRVEFSAKANGVVGTNGKGKSNLIKAIRVLITGRTDREDSFADDITDGQPSCHLELGFVHDGIPGTIKRRLYRTASNTAAVHWGDTRIDGITETNAFLTTMLGVTPDNLEKYAFVGQDRLRAVLFDTPSKRMDNMIAMIPDIAKSRIIKERLDRFSDTIPEITLPYDRDYLVSRLEFLGTEIKDLEHKERVLEAELQTLGPSALQESILSVCREADKNKKRRVSLENRKADLMAAAVAKLQFKKELETRRPSVRIPDDFDPMEARQKCQAFSNFDFKKLREAEESLDGSLESKLDDMRSSRTLDLEYLESMKIEVCELRDQSVVARHTINASREALNKWAVVGSGSTECPLCGSSVDSQVFEQRQEADQQSLRDAEALADSLRVLISEKNSEIGRQESVLSELEKQIRDAERKLEAAKLVVATLVPPEYDEGTFSEAQTLLVAYEDNQKISATLVACDAEIQTMFERVAQTEADLQELGDVVNINPDDEKAAEVKLACIKARGSELDTTKRGIVHAEACVVETQELLNKVDAAIESRAAVTDFKARVAAIKELLHRDRLPKIALQYYLDTFRERLTHHITKFGAPFNVVIGDDFSIAFIKDGRPPCAIHRLSGGEKSVVSTALHLAVADMFNGGANFLVLDEPSQNMDSEYVSTLTAIIEAASGGTDGKQLIIVTHHTNEMLAAFDNVIRL